jgi:hypothetical protein
VIEVLERCGFLKVSFNNFSSLELFSDLSLHPSYLSGLSRGYLADRTMLLFSIQVISRMAKLTNVRKLLTAKLGTVLEIVGFKMKTVISRSFLEMMILSARQVTELVLSKSSQLSR